MVHLWLFVAGNPKQISCTFLVLLGGPLRWRQTRRRWRDEKSASMSDFRFSQCESRIFRQLSAGHLTRTRPCSSSRMRQLFVRCHLYWQTMLTLNTAIHLILRSKHTHTHPNGRSRRGAFGVIIQRLNFPTTSEHNRETCATSSLAAAIQQPQCHDDHPNRLERRNSHLALSVKSEAATIPTKLVRNC
jgi:hypothetical protein